MKKKTKKGYKLPKLTVAMSKRCLYSRSVGTITMDHFVNQVGALALGTLYVYEDGDLEVGWLGKPPTKEKPLKKMFQLAAYPKKEVPVLKKNKTFKLDPKKSRF